MVKLHIIIKHSIQDNKLFWLYNTDAGFRNESYECYSKLVEKYPYLKSETEMLFLFIKDYHRVISNEEINVYVVHCYDDMGDHTATSGWYYVDRSTGDVIPMH